MYSHIYVLVYLCTCVLVFAVIHGHHWYSDESVGRELLDQLGGAGLGLALAGPPPPVSRVMS